MIEVIIYIVIFLFCYFFAFGAAWVNYEEHKERKRELKKAKEN